MSSNSLSWENGQEACRSNGGDLASFETEAEVKAVKKMLLSHKNHEISNLGIDQEMHFIMLGQRRRFDRWLPEDFFIGGFTDDVEKGAWFWTSGASLTQDVPQWGTRGKARGPKCVRLELRAFWNILNWSSDDCQRVLNYLCEIQMPPSS